MKTSDIFKIRLGSCIIGLIGAEKKILEVSEITDLTLRLDLAKFRVGFRTTDHKLWSVSEKSKAELFVFWNWDFLAGIR